jgi:hypothetical protein
MSKFVHSQKLSKVQPELVPVSRRKRNNRKLNYIFPSEIWRLISIYLFPEGVISLGVTCKLLLKTLSLELINLRKEHKLYHRCMNEIQNFWNNELAPRAQNTARSQLDQYKSPVCCGWEASVHDELQCSIYPGKSHLLKVTYVYNPRDVNMIAWFINNKRIGCIML